MATENGKVQKKNILHIDNVISSHPELGPCPPDGGYGWLVLFSAIITQITVPSVLSSYGILILDLNLQEEYEKNDVFGLWDKNIALIPILATVFWLLLEPWSRTVVLIANRPRVVSISGIFLLSAGVMLSHFSAENQENEVMINIFSGIFSGTGAALTTQQADLLLKHYFRKKIFTIQTIYKTTITIGNIFVPLLMGSLIMKYGPSISIIIYAGIIMQTCIALAAFSRPTYITQPLRKNYKMLQEACEDEDEDIYSSQAQIDQIPGENPNADKEAHPNTLEVTEDDQDEHVISAFNSANIRQEVIRQSPPTSINQFGSNFVDMDRIDRLEDPSSLYRETTIINDIPPSNIFTFDPPPGNSGTARRTANNRKNISIFFSIMRDARFYVNTHIVLALRFSMLVMGMLYPAYISQQVPTMDMWTVVEMVVIVYIGATCLNIVTAFLAHHSSKKTAMRLFSLAAFVGFVALTMTDSRSWLVLWGVLTNFAVIAMYILQEPIYETMKVDFDATIIYSTSNCIVALCIFLIAFTNNNSYAMLFKIAAGLQLLVPFLCFYL